MANLKSTTISDTGFLQLPTGTTGERPSSPAAGEIRFNTDTKVTEWYDNQLDAWFPTGVVPPVATGGDTVEDVDIDGVTYRIHSFTSVGESTFTVTRGGSVDYLIVAGGGGGGSDRAGGGGAGGFFLGTTTVSIGTKNIFVGEGGLGGQGDELPGNNGENSSALGFTALGGGGGGANGNQESGLSGGSGGGGMGKDSSADVGGNGVPGQGNKGGDGDFTNSVSYGGASGGGGGAGSPGGDGTANGPGGAGGLGIGTDISGVTKFYGGGGGGGIDPRDQGDVPGVGGIGGGGTGGSATPTFGGTIFPEDGEPNTGGGGGGGALDPDNSGGGAEYYGGDGGSGIVIIRYRIS